VALHAATIRFADRSYVAVARAADAQGISVSQYVREAALIRAVLDELDTAEEALHTAHDLLAVAREVRQLAQVDPPARRDQTPTSGPARSRAASRDHQGWRVSGAPASRPRPKCGRATTFRAALTKRRRRRLHKCGHGAIPPSRRQLAL
jgi:hypothetical protein